MNNSSLIFDIECNGLKNPDTIWVIAIKEYGSDPDNTQVFSYDKGNIEEGITILQEADELIGHNIIGFDIPVLNSIYNIDLAQDKKITDTLVMSRLYNPIREGGHSLDKWGYKVKIYKQESPEQWDRFDPKMIPYCIQDVVVNEAVYDSLLIEGKGFSDECLEIEHAVTSILEQQQNNGFYFDEKKGMTLLANLNKRMKEVKDKVRKVFKPKWVDDKIVKPYIKKDGDLSKRGLTDEEYEKVSTSKNYDPFMRKKYQQFNLGSRKQIGEYLKDFGWKPERFTPTGQPIIDEGTLKKIEHIPEAKLIAEFLLLQKRIAQINSWLEGVENNRVHGRVISMGTITSRMSHHSPNVAQVPSLKSEYGAECRDCWTVPEGYKLVGIDASGLEIRMLAHYMNDTEYTNEIINGDIHSRNQKIAGLKTRDNA